jgi:hypothetical protein
MPSKSRVGCKIDLKRLCFDIGSGFNKKFNNIYESLDFAVFISGLDINSLNLGLNYLNVRKLTSKQGKLKCQEKSLENKTELNLSPSKFKLNVDELVTRGSGRKVYITSFN